jgi:hypothetical protein
MSAVILSERELLAADYAFWESHCAQLARQRVAAIVLYRDAEELVLCKAHTLAVMRREDSRKRLNGFYDYLNP